MTTSRSPSHLSATRLCHCLAARRRARSLTRRYDQSLRPHGLRATQFSILAALALKGPSLVGELADILGLDRTTLSRSSDVLEQKGWVGTAPSEDGRERRLELTARGLGKVEGAFRDWKEVQDSIDRENEADRERAG